MSDIAQTAAKQAPSDLIATTAALMVNIVRNVVDQPKRVSLTTITRGGNTLFVVTVTLRDFESIFGIQGRTLRSLRTILDAIGKRSGKRLLIDIEAEQVVH
jgi:predicted RNA-binding protein YlqC (UPF0109 family)